MRKFIIEKYNNSQTFGILFIDSNRKGRLRYFCSNADNSNFWEVEEYADYMDALVEMAQKVCEREEATLVSY